MRVVNRIGRDVPIATGFAVNADGFVVTVGQQSLKKARQVKVVPLPDTGAEYEVQQSHYHPSLELTVLHAPGLSIPPLSLDRLDAGGQRVFVPFAKPDVSLVRGSFDGLVSRPVRAYASTEHKFLKHNTDIRWEGYGAPLLNERGLVIGVNHLNPDLPANRLARKTKPDGRVFAVPAFELQEFLRSENISFVAYRPSQALPVPAPQPPVQRTPPPKDAQQRASATNRELEAARAALRREREAREDAETAALQARQKANEMERLAKEAESKTAVSEQEKRAARQSARLAKAAAEEAEKEAGDAVQRAAVAEQLAAKKEQEAKEAAAARQAAADEAETARRNIYLIAGVAVVVLLTVAGGWIAYSRRSAKRVDSAVARAADAEQAAQHARHEAAAGRKRAPFDCILEGRAPNSRRFTLKIPAETLGVDHGVVLGRNPQYATVVVDHEEISREHAKLTVVNGVLHVEDLRSTNGTFANNTQLRSGQKVALYDASTMRLGSISFTVSLA